MTDSISDKIFSIAEEFPLKNALCINEDGWWDFQRLVTSTDLFKIEFIQSGVIEFSLVAIVGDLCNSTISVFLALQSLGATACFLGAEINSTDLDERINNSLAEFIVDPKKETIIHTGFNPTENFTRYKKIALLKKRWPSVVFYTSGTSGKSKGVQLTKRNISSTVLSLLDYLPINESNVVASFSSIYSDFGFYNIILPLCVGSSAVYIDQSTSINLIFLKIIYYKINVIHAFPPLLEKIYEGKAVEKNVFPCMDYICSSGQRMKKSTIEKILNHSPSCELHLGYGLTECKRALSLHPKFISEKPDSVGKPIFGVKAYLVDNQRDQVRKTNTQGELCLVSDQVTCGYFYNDFDTKKIIKKLKFSNEIALFTGDFFTRMMMGFIISYQENLELYL
ncbi:class I adenylate-forming enzyme family protein [Marinomonas sp. TI.3.20]|uniref:class I adenylate-forming enzyme family protein n=1 Tax=Marinomonas sp. TI.3.20 TaxID=3121296 RepID=UPI00311DC257